MVVLWFVMSIKRELHALCKAQLDKQVRDIEQAIEERREAIGNETKSSMGDKYETTREMLQQEINMSLERLSKAKTEMATLDTIDPDNSNTQIAHGSLVYTDSGNYYLAVSAGKFTVENILYYTISVAAPIAKQLIGRKAGDVISLNGKDYLVKEVK